MRTDFDFNYVKSCMKNEGFDYCFTEYSDFKEEINDEEFHKLRTIYLKSRRDLKNYVINKASEEQKNDKDE